MKIHAIKTGTVAITTKWREGAGGGRLRLVNTLLDREWTEPLPIYAFAIEHPEGVIIVDTGETARVSEPGYFPRWQPFFRFAVREQVQPEQEIGPQLKLLGILPSDVRRVVLTHLHTDHAGGLRHFPDTKILVSRAEVDYAAGLRGRVRGYPNKRWPAWFGPTVVDLPAVPFGPFPASMALTQVGDVTLVPVPGHTPGQLAVVVKDGDHAVFLAGDSSYTQDALLRGVVDGVGPDEAAERLTHERILAYAAETPTVYLPAHDPETAARLAARRPIQAALGTRTRVSDRRAPAPPKGHVMTELNVGALLKPRELVTIHGAPVQVPQPARLVHLQFRRYAGCPICNMHLRSITQRHEEILAAGICEVVVFHSSTETMLGFQGALPFAAIADPDKTLYAEFGVGSALKAVLNPRAPLAGFRARSVVHSVRGAIGIGEQHLGLPADFLIAPDGLILAAKYGKYASDQWSVDELLKLASSHNQQLITPANTPTPAATPA